MGEVSPPRTVQIGDEAVTIARFRGLKALLAGALVSKVMKEVPELQESASRFRNEFREKNTTKITRAMARLERFEPLGLTADDFDRAGEDYIEFPEDPTGFALLVHLFPDLYELARGELTRFFGILVISNRNLEAADDADTVDQVLLDEGKRIIRQGDIDELLELIAAGADVFQDQIMSKKDKLGKLQGLPFLRNLLSTPETPDSTQPSQTQEEEPTEESLLSPLASSTDSPTDSDGTEEPLSTASPGTSSGS